jgi:hypothetical protein
MKLPYWVLREPVEVTGIYNDPNAVVQIVLVQRTAKYADRACVVVTFRGGDGIELDGVRADLGDDAQDLCSLADDANGRANPEGLLQVGQMVLSYPFPD